MVSKQVNMFLVGSDLRELRCAANMMQSFRRPLLDLWHFLLASDAQWQVCARLGKRNTYQGYT